MSPRLEAILLSCLEKEPAKRPQSALELRHLLDGCGIAPWDAEDAQSWWLAHQRELEQAGDRGESSLSRRTVAIDGSRGAA